MQIVDAMTHRAVKSWMEDVLAENNWTARHWAELADTSHTNITRVLHPATGADPVMPRLDTLGRLARMAGSQPNLLQRVSQRRDLKTAGPVSFRVPSRSAPRRHA